MVKATWGVYVDWENDGDVTGTGENVTARVLNEPGVVFERGRDQIRALAPPMAGRCEFVLNNASKDYSVEYASGPLYGNLLPGREIAINTTSPVLATQWVGRVDDLQQEPFLKGGGRVRIPGLGMLARLKGIPVWVDLQENITTSAALALLFAEAGLAGSAYTLLDTGQTTLTAWWCAGDDAFDMLRKLLAAEGPGSAIYEQADGRIAFHSRHYRLLTARSTTSQVTFGNASTEPKHSLPFSYQPNLKDVVNSVTVAAAALSYDRDELRDLATIPVVPAVTLAPAGVAVISVVLDAPADLESTPGFYESPNLTLDGVAVGAYSATYDQATGLLFTLTITSAASYTFTFDAVVIRGYPSVSTALLVPQTVDASASQAKYGTRGLPGGFSPWPYITAVAAQELANSVVVNYREPRATVSVTIANANSTRLTQQLTREISDRVTVVESQTGLNAAMFVERIRHEVREGGRFHRTTFGCEKVGAYDDYFVFDVDNFDGESFGF